MASTSPNTTQKATQNKTDRGSFTITNEMLYQLS
jgi:hypothetical protein